MNDKKGTRIVVTGAGRGLGLAFTRLWLQSGATVCALARNADSRDTLASVRRDHAGSLHLVECDIADDGSVGAAAKKVGEALGGVDILVNNAGIYGPKGDGLTGLDLDAIRQVFEINTLGPLRVTRAMLPLLRQGDKARVAHVTSLMGSIEDNTSGGSYPYRISKAALNMAGRNMAHDLEGESVVSVVVHPGWVRTDMGGSDAPLEIDEAVGAMIRTIEGLTPAQAGSFLDRDGQRLPW